MITGSFYAHPCADPFANWGQTGSTPSHHSWHSYREEDLIGTLPVNECKYCRVPSKVGENFCGQCSAPLYKKK